MDSTSQGLWSDTASQAAAAYGVPPNIFSALINQESGWQPYALGSSGEVGFTQLMPNTAASLGVNAWDPVSNLYGGASYLSGLFKKYGNWTDALAAYNAGTPSSSAGQSYAATILKAAGYNASNATATASTAAPASANTTAPSWWDVLKSVYDPNSASSQATRAQMSQAFNQDMTAKGLGPDNPVAQATGNGAAFGKAWDFLSSGQAVVYLVAGVGLVFVTYFGIKALFALHEGTA